MQEYGGWAGLAEGRRLGTLGNLFFFLVGFGLGLDLGLGWDWVGAYIRRGVAVANFFFSHFCHFFDFSDFLNFNLRFFSL